MDHKTQKMPSRLLCLCLVAVMLLAMVPANVLQAEAVSAEQKVYFNPTSDWKKDGAWFAAYFFNNSNNIVNVFFAKLRALCFNHNADNGFGARFSNKNSALIAQFLFCIFINNCHFKIIMRTKSFKKLYK